MDILAILALVSKGVTIANSLIEAGQSAAPAIAALKAAFVDKKEPTQADLDQCEAALDALIDDFLTPLPDQG